MAVNNIWVFSQANDDEATTASLELLTKASSLGGTVTAFVAGVAGGACCSSLIMAPPRSTRPATLPEPSRAPLSRLQCRQ